MIATGSIGAAVQGLGACSTSGDELTELLAGITGTEVVSAGQLGSNLSVPGAALFPEPPAEGGVHPRLVPSPGFTAHPWGFCGRLSPPLVWRRASGLGGLKGTVPGCPFLAK